MKSKIEADPQWAPLRILILEDIPSDAELMKRELENAGIAFISRRVDKRDDFLRQLEEFSPDIVLSDYTMPLFDGLEAIKLVQELYPFTPIIVVTGSINEETAVECLRAGASDYVLKERLKRIGSAVEGALEKKRMREENEKAKKELIESEAKYRALFEGAANGILIVDIQTKKFRYSNPAFSKMIGYTEAELRKMSVSDIHPKAVLEHVISEFETQARGEKTLSQDIPCLRKDGTILYADITTSCVSIDGDDCNVGFFTDVSERKQLEAQLIQSQKMEAIGKLAGGVAHDFNNLLTSIIGNATLVSMKLEKDSPLHEYPEQIIKAGDSAASLTRQLLAFSRKQVLQPEVLDLNALLQGIEKMLRRLIGEDVELKLILTPQLGNIEADPGQIEQIIMNLAVNARDAMPQGGKLTIETADVVLDKTYALRRVAVKPGPHVMMAISDNGGGMDEETCSHIFEPFFTTKAKGEGTGLGLSTVYGIVKQSAGYIWTYSEPGEGTTFKIYMPRVEKEITEITKTNDSAKSLEGSETVLVVEDEKMVRQMAHKVLQGYGYAVLEAKNGEEAIAISQKHEGPIHLMLTDVVMPGMSGRVLAERFESLRPETKVLYMSGYTDNIIVHHGILDRKKRFIQKPFTHESLARKVREVLDGMKKS